MRIATTLVSGSLPDEIFIFSSFSAAVRAVSITKNNACCFLCDSSVSACVYSFTFVNRDLALAVTPVYLRSGSDRAKQFVVALYAVLRRDAHVAAECGLPFFQVVVHSERPRAAWMYPGACTLSFDEVLV